MVSSCSDRLAGLGGSMDQYEVLSTTGFVKVDDILCRRFTIYEKTGDDKRGDSPSSEGCIV